MINTLYKIINFSSFSNSTGTLTPIQFGPKDNEIPFVVKKTLITQGMKESDVRGDHTHHKMRQVLIVITGECDVELDSGKEKLTITLSKLSEGLLLEPYLWHKMKNFKKNTILLVLADTVYDEKDYIRDYEEFKKLIQK